MHKTFVGIAYIILIAYYPIINEFKTHVNAIACLYVFVQRLIFPAYMKYNIEDENICV